MSSDDANFYDAVRTKFGQRVCNVIPGVVLLSWERPVNSAAVFAELRQIAPSLSAFVTRLHPSEIAGGLPDDAKQWLLSTWAE